MHGHVWVHVIWLVCNPAGLRSVSVLKQQTPHSDYWPTIPSHSVPAVSPCVGIHPFQHLCLSDHSPSQQGGFLLKNIHHLSNLWLGVSDQLSFNAGGGEVLTLCVFTIDQKVDKTEPYVTPQQPLSDFTAPSRPRLYLVQITAKFAPPLIKSGWKSGHLAGCI